MSYIKVTQDAAGLLFKESPQHIQGLVTTRLQSGIATLVQGSLGIALLHDSGNLSGKSIQQVFSQLGEITFWTTAFNPAGEACGEKMPEGEPGSFKDKYLRISQTMAELLGATSKSTYIPSIDDFYHKAEKGFVSVDRDFNISTERPSKLPVISRTDLRLRIAIYSLNMLLIKDQECECDLQFNGYSFTEGPSLTIEASEIKSQSKTDKEFKKRFKAYQREEKRFEKYKKKLETILKKFNVQTHLEALCQALEKNDERTVLFLIKKVGDIDLNLRDLTQAKTPLDYATENENLKLVEILRRHGASALTKDTPRNNSPHIPFKRKNTK